MAYCRHTMSKTHLRHYVITSNNGVLTIVRSLGSHKYFGEKMRPYRRTPPNPDAPYRKTSPNQDTPNVERLHTKMPHTLVINTTYYVVALSVSSYLYLVCMRSVQLICIVVWTICVWSVRFICLYCTRFVALVRFVCALYDLYLSGCTLRFVCAPYDLYACPLTDFEAYKQIVPEAHHRAEPTLCVALLFPSVLLDYSMKVGRSQAPLL